MRKARQTKLIKRADRKRAVRITNVINTAMHKVPPNKKQNPILIIPELHSDSNLKQEWEKYFRIEMIKGRRAYIDPDLYKLISKADGKIISTHMTYNIAVKYAECHIRIMENIILGNK